MHWQIVSECSTSLVSKAKFLSGNTRRCLDLISIWSCPLTDLWSERATLICLPNYPVAPVYRGDLPTPSFAKFSRIRRFKEIAVMLSNLTPRSFINSGVNDWKTSLLNFSRKIFSNSFIAPSLNLMSEFY